MRILTIIGICLLIVTLAVGATARDRDSRDRDSEKASSNDSRSSNRHDSGSSDQQSSSPRFYTYQHESTPSTDNSQKDQTSNNQTPDHSSTPAHVDNQPQVQVQPEPLRTTQSVRDAKLGEAREIGRENASHVDSNITGYTPHVDGNTSSSQSDSGKSPYDYYGVNRHNENSALNQVEDRNSYRPDHQIDTVNGAGSQNDNHSGYYLEQSQPKADAMLTTQSQRDLKLAQVRTEAKNYERDRSTSRSNNEAAKNPYSTYSPMSDERFHPNTTDKAKFDWNNNHNQDQGKDHSNYKPGADHNSLPDVMPTTQSIRDRKLAEARMAATKSYQPSSYKPHYSLADYHMPKGYKPPSYREGHYYYSHPHYTRPCNYGFWSFDYYSGYCRRSMYYHYGLFPYIQVTRIVVDSYPTIVYVGEPIYTIYGHRYNTDRYPGLNDTLSDIRSAWVSGRLDLLDRHVRDSHDIAVLLDGRYDYSISPDDYVQMTEDAMSEMDTDGFVWDKVQCRRSGEITAFATHTYRTGGVSRTVYTSYTFQRISGQYYITEIGTTQTPWN